MYTCHSILTFSDNSTWSHIFNMPYRKGPAMREMVAKEVNKMLHSGVIEPTSTDWASPVFLVPKKDGSLGFSVDYRRLNTKMAADSYLLPQMDDCIDLLRNEAVFTTSDCNSGYWQIPVALEDRDHVHHAYRHVSQFAYAGRAKRSTGHFPTCPRNHPIWLPLADMPRLPG